MTKFIVAFIVTLIFFSSSLFPEKLAVLPELNRPSMMDVSGSELYILDDFQVKVYSLKDYRLLRKFGKKGQGPGELFDLPDSPLTMIVGKEKVLLNSLYKIIVYEKSGKMLKEKKFAPSFLIEAVSHGKNYALTKFWRKDGTAVATTCLFSPDLKELKKLCETTIPNSYKKRKIVMPPVSTFARCGSDRLFVFDQTRTKDFTIKVFDLEGKPLPDIKASYRELMMGDSFNKKVMDTLRAHPAFKILPPDFKKMLHIPEVLPVFRQCRVKDGKLYVQTYREKGDLSEFYILDFSGKVLKKIFLPGADRLQIRINPAATYTFQGGKYYYLVDDIDEEQWELHVKKLD
ncbi:MAG: hypothetical protein KAW12_01570 [Candidatus Aminicenantes bacterium]|nr:hypothetical protein [Candidatus Aminicenantes bacterium]